MSNKKSHNSQISALQEFDLCFGSGSTLEVNVGCTARGFLPLGRWGSVDIAPSRRLNPKIIWFVEPFPETEMKLNE